jgi:hypothetical protein
MATYRASNTSKLGEKNKKVLGDDQRIYIDKCAGNKILQLVRLTGKAETVWNDSVRVEQNREAVHKFSMEKSQKAKLSTFKDPILATLFVDRYSTGGKIATPIF